MPNIILEMHLNRGSPQIQRSCLPFPFHLNEANTYSRHINISWVKSFTLLSLSGKLANSILATLASKHIEK